MVLADTLSTIGSLGSVVAAGAALMAVLYARSTVREARAGRREATEAHTREAQRQVELIEATKSAHEQEASQQLQLLQATQAAHQQEMVDRARALASELVLQRLTQVGRVEELIGEVADIARFEIEHPPQRIAGQIGTWSRVTGALARLEAAIVICQRLGVAGGVGDVLAEARKMSIDYRRVGTPPQTVVGEAMGMLDRMKFITETDESLAFPGQSAF